MHIAGCSALITDGAEVVCLVCSGHKKRKACLQLCAKHSILVHTITLHFKHHLHYVLRCLISWAFTDSHERFPQRNDIFLYCAASGGGPALCWLCTSAAVLWSGSGCCGLFGLSDIHSAAARSCTFNQMRQWLLLAPTHGIIISDLKVGTHSYSLTHTVCLPPSM